MACFFTGFLAIYPQSRVCHWTFDRSPPKFTLWVTGRQPPYRNVYVPSCFWFDAQLIERALSRALFSAGRSMPARMAMIAITTRSSTRVNFLNLRFRHCPERKLKIESAVDWSSIARPFFCLFCLLFIKTAIPSFFVFYDLGKFLFRLFLQTASLVGRSVMMCGCSRRSGRLRR